MENRKKVKFSDKNDIKLFYKTEGREKNDEHSEMEVSQVKDGNIKRIVKDGEEELVDEKDDQTATGSLFSRANEYPMMAFNLREERQIGRFDNALGFIQTRRGAEETEEVEQDVWLQTVDENDPRTMITAERRSDLQEKRRREEEEREAASYETIDQLSVLLQADETVLQALSRFGSGKKDVSKIEELSELSTRLLGSFPDIYEKTKIDLRLLVDSHKLEKMKGVFWEYRVSSEVEGGGAQVHGPFSSFEMQQWRSQGYFSGEQSVMLRRADPPGNKKAVKTSETPSSKSELTRDLFEEDESDDGVEEGEQGDNEEAGKSAEKWINSESIVFDKIDLSTPLETPS